MIATAGDGNRYRVWLNGEEVTNRCVEADTGLRRGEGFALCYKLRNGEPYSDNGMSLEIERLYGDVQIEVTSRAS